MEDIEDIARQNLKAIVAAYRKGTGRSLAAVSKELYGNVIFLEAFFAGTQTVSFKMMNTLLDKLRAKWPAGVPWPTGRVIVFRGPEKVQKSPEKSAAA